MKWEIGIGLLVLYLFIKLYRFKNYIKTYLIPWDIRIIANEKKGDFFELNFTVVFAQGYFKKRFYTAIGQLESKNEFTKSTLKAMLSLTEINTFLNPQNELSPNSGFVYNYLFFNSMENALSNNEGKYSVTYQVIPDNTIDKIRDSFRRDNGDQNGL